MIESNDSLAHRFLNRGSALRPNDNTVTAIIVYRREPINSLGVQPRFIAAARNRAPSATAASDFGGQKADRPILCRNARPHADKSNELKELNSKGDGRRESLFHNMVWARIRLRHRTVDCT